MLLCTEEEMQPTYDCICLGDVITNHCSCHLVLMHGVGPAGGGLDQNLGGIKERERERERACGGDLQACIERNCLKFYKIFLSSYSETALSIVCSFIHLEYAALFWDPQHLTLSAAIA